MSQFLNFLRGLSFWLGLLSIVAAIVIKLMQAEWRAHVTGHTLFVVAGTFFLCAIATRAMEKA